MRRGYRSCALCPALCLARCLVLSVAALLLVPTPAAAQDEPGALRRNPFSRPASVVDLGDASGPLVEERRVEFELRATLVADGTALANIDGTILGVGQVYAGYRIDRIEEGRVHLSGDEARLVLDVYRRQIGAVEERD